MINLNGLGVAMVTPFNENGAVDYPALQRNTEHLINSDVDFLVVLGTTAETPTLSLDEKRSVLDFIIELNNKRLGSLDASHFQGLIAYDTQKIKRIAWRLYPKC